MPVSVAWHRAVCKVGFRHGCRREKVAGRKILETICASVAGFLTSAARERDRIPIRRNETRQTRHVD